MDNSLARRRERLAHWGIVLAMVMVGLFCLGWHATARARASDAMSEGNRPRDIYLRGDRICRQCTWRLVNPAYVELTDGDGRTGLYPRQDIVGVDTHPWRRRVFKKALDGIGLPSRIVVPAAYEAEPALVFPRNSGGEPAGSEN